jgi:hypothetical protein
MLTSLENDDPGYYDAFWTEPGYEGADRPDALAHLLVDTTGIVRRVVPGSEATGMMATFLAIDPEASYAIELDLDDGTSASRLVLANVTFLDGKAKGRDLLITDVDNDVLIPFGERTPELAEGVLPGDRVSVNNRKCLAFCFYYWHAVEPVKEYAERSGLPTTAAGRPYTVDGLAVFPQRPGALTIDRDEDLPGGAGYKGRSKAR